MVFFQFGEENKEAITLILEALKNQFPEITSLQYAINTKQNDSMYDLDVVCYHGKSYITEQMPAYFEGSEPLNFHVGPKSFYQTNSEQAFELYKTALDFAGLTGGETVYDLYTGTGTIALFIAQKAKKVVGVESVKEAIDDAWLNAEVNGITNADFVVGDMKDVFTPEFIQTHGRPDVIVTDPPRDGMHQKVVQQLLELAAPRIVYVSCNPATQARDLALLSELYDVKLSRAVDMFPQTQHIENVVLLEKK
jgi:23S rRNA (uracil1939-C5)-methyltransferase